LAHPETAWRWIFGSSSGLLSQYEAWKVCEEKVRLQRLQRYRWTV
jgi:hypothetical protein